MFPRLPVIALLVLAASCAAPGGDVAEVTAPTIESHSWFPIAAGNHANIDCNVCHGAFDTFTKFDCLSCHPQASVPPHLGVADYTYDSPNCYRCHPTGEATTVNHGPIFPIGAGTKHETVSCGQCHLSSQDRSQLACAGCHLTGDMTSAHTGVRDYAFASMTCLQCHADSQVDRLATHLPFVITYGKHASKACLRCHDAVRADKPFPAADFGAFNCMTCHAGEHRGRYSNDQCLECHADGFKHDDD